MQRTIGEILRMLIAPSQRYSASATGCVVPTDLQIMEFRTSLALDSGRVTSSADHAIRSNEHVVAVSDNRTRMTVQSVVVQILTLHLVYSAGK